MFAQNDVKALLADVGNSRIKVSSLTAPQSLTFICETVEELVTWIDAQNLETFYYASVRSDEVMAPLIELCKLKNIRLQSIKTEKHFAGLTNSYEDVSTMGVDRWLSMLACLNKEAPNFAVLMFGTAITCDIVSEGQHLGGWIIPGRQLMQDALTNNTARVFANDSLSESIQLGNSTPACVDFGCFAAASGVIAMAENYLCSHFDQYCIFLTGGDDKVLTSQKGDAIVRADNLVLQGLSRYANYR